jgi:soluble lytic murein transglycosylase-like protein
MNKRKLMTGLATAGVFSAGFGAAVLPASAEQRSLTVTLLGGQTVQVVVDVPPGTPLDQVTIPGITTPIVGIQDNGAVAPPPAPAPQPAPEQPAAEQPAARARPRGARDLHLPGQARQARQPEVERDEPAVPEAERQSRQPTTGDEIRKAEPEPKAPAAAPEPPPPPPPRTRDRRRACSPPDVSLAVPGPAPVGVPNFFIDKFRIPPFLLPIYQAAGIEYGVRWEILAAINEIETDYGRNLNVSSAGALGWMQFMPATVEAYGVDANDDGTKDPFNPVDAIFAAARYLKAADADTDIRKAIFAYNHATGTSTPCSCGAGSSAGCRRPRRLAVRA